MRAKLNQGLSAARPWRRRSPKRIPKLNPWLTSAAGFDKVPLPSRVSRALRCRKAPLPGLQSGR